MKAVVESNTHDSQIKTGNQRDEDMRYASEDTYLLVSLFSLSLPPGSEQFDGESKMTPFSVDYADNSFDWAFAFPTTAITFQSQPIYFHLLNGKNGWNSPFVICFPS